MSYCVISHNPDWCAVVVFRISVTYSAQTTDWVPCQTVGIRCFGAQLSVDRPLKKTLLLKIIILFLVQNCIIKCN